MSRYKKWTSSLNGLSNSMKVLGFEVNSKNYQAEEKMIREFCETQNIRGAFSERVLQVSLRYDLFKEFLKTKTTTK